MTNKDGSQSVQTINRELGMNQKDLADIKARLGEQGLQGDYNVDLYGKADNREKAKNPNAAPGKRRPPTPPPVPTTCLL